MDELLSKQNIHYRDLTREIAEKHVKPIAAELDRTGEYPWPVIKALQEAGLMGVWIPKDYGGDGAGVLNLCIVVEELSRACGGIGVTYAVNSLGSFPIILGGTEEQKKKYLPDIASGKKLIAYALSEKAAGSDAGSLKTQAVKDGNDYVITGDKKWTTNAGAANIFTVFATVNPDRGTRGVTGFLVERGMQGFEIGKREDLMGIRCVPVHETHLRGCRVGPEQMLGGTEGRGFKHAMMTLDSARPAVAAQALGLAQGALDLALEYTKKREQFGQSIASFQAIQFMLADMATQVEAARQLVYAAARALDAGAPNVSKIAAMSKVFASDTAMKVTTDAVQLFGGYGYCKDYPIEKFMRDAKITQIYEGTNQIQRVVIGRALIKEGASGE
ncbi:MAG TPA: acyl-CoA dehydrogenase family protein, partial [Blastocatellia bacterium]|nr:acyl-CoA dehydrogenase family protein [Blastocatellia bacterium]